jgi:hypothetical protein
MTAKSNNVLAQEAVFKVQTNSPLMMRGLRGIMNLNFTSEWRVVFCSGIQGQTNAVHLPLTLSMSFDPNKDISSL